MPGLLVALLALAAIGLPQGVSDQGFDPPELGPTVVETELTVVTVGLPPAAGSWQPKPWGQSFDLHGQSVRYEANVSVLEAPESLHKQLVSSLEDPRGPPCAVPILRNGGNNATCSIRGVPADNVTTFLLQEAPGTLGRSLEPSRTIFVIDLEELGRHAFLSLARSPPYNKLVALADHSDTWTDPTTGTLLVDVAAETHPEYGGAALAPPSKLGWPTVLDRLVHSALRGVFMTTPEPTIPPVQGDLTIAFTTIAPETPRFDGWARRVSAAGGPQALVEPLTFLREVTIEDRGVIRDDALLARINEGSSRQDGARALDLDNLFELIRSHEAISTRTNDTTHGLLLAYDEPVFIDNRGALAAGVAKWPDAFELPVAIGAFDTTLRDGRQHDPQAAPGYWQAQKNLVANLMVHEIGHVLSLPHPHDNWGPADASLSPMSYRINTGEHIYPYTRWDRQTYARAMLVGNLTELKGEYEQTRRIVEGNAPYREDQIPAFPIRALQGAARTIDELDAIVLEDPGVYDAKGQQTVETFADGVDEARKDIQAARAYAEDPPDPAHVPTPGSPFGLAAVLSLVAFAYGERRRQT